ncbi:hypothetical protein M426DRAFT_51986 [Hypoxylon sp. CI-4A]|nr:hypothetical protein M426DRAFT_51986 [Hypoxylon sp. CI-4A]
MEELLQKAIKENEETKKALNSVPWKPDQPHPQPYHAFNSSKQQWEPKTPQNTSSTGPGINRLALYSWNIDFMLPFAKARMDAALAHLEETLTRRLPAATAAVVFLQECVAEDLATIGEKAWVRDRFHVTDVDGASWAARYGTATLVDRRLDVARCFRVHYAKTNMQRDAFFVDVKLGGGGGSKSGKTIRLCNTHLESLARKPALRPAQMQLAATYMHARGVDGALAAGDFNAIQPFDRTLHSDNGLKDAYLELGGKEDSEDGYTWGQQAATTSRNRFGCTRMDKVYFTGGVKLLGFARFGADVMLTGREHTHSLDMLGFDKPWITDHLGVMAEVEVVE